MTRKKKLSALQIIDGLCMMYLLWRSGFLDYMLEQLKKAEKKDGKKEV